MPNTYAATNAKKFLDADGLAYLSQKIKNKIAEDVAEAVEDIQVTSESVISALGYTPADVQLKGASNGLAELDLSGKVPTSQLPSYVDEVIEYRTRDDFPLSGSGSIIYIDESTNLTYRWSGSDYVEISPSIAIGETAQTAFRGDRGASAYSHASAKGNAYVSGLYKFSTNSEGHVINAVPVEKADIDALGFESITTSQIDSLFT